MNKTMHNQQDRKQWKQHKIVSKKESNVILNQILDMVRHTARLIDCRLTARQHKTGQFVPFCQR